MVNRLGFITLVPLSSQSVLLNTLPALSLKTKMELKASGLCYIPADMLVVMKKVVLSGNSEMRFPKHWILLILPILSCMQRTKRLMPPVNLIGG